MSKRGVRTPAGGSRTAGHPRQPSESVSSFDEARTTLAPRLRARFPELIASLENLVEVIPNPPDVPDAAYLESLHATRIAFLDYIVGVIELGERRAPGIPPAALASVRLAARSGVALDTVLRRYSAANGLFSDILIEEAERAGVPPPVLRRLLHRQVAIFDRLFEAAGEEYVRETNSLPATTAGWHHEYIKGLLAGRHPNGELEPDYDLEGHHIGLMAKGDRGGELMRKLANRLDRRLLAGRPEEEPVWTCWLGGRSPLDADQMMRALGEAALDQVIVAVGEPAEGLAGWRLSHRQAEAALPIAERKGQQIVRYADVAVLVSILRDDLGANSLRRFYLEPLEGLRDGGAVARETLRAYFAAGRNISSTAAALRVDRRTVTNRLRAVEDLLGRTLGDCATDLETALRLAD